MEALCRKTTIIARAPSSGGAKGDNATNICHVGLTFLFRQYVRPVAHSVPVFLIMILFLAVLFGNLLLGIYTAFLGFIGAKTGLSTHLLARYSFGVKGSWLPSLLLGGTQVGWFGVGVAMFAIPVGESDGDRRQYPDCGFRSV